MKPTGPREADASYDLLEREARPPNHPSGHTCGYDRCQTGRGVEPSVANIPYHEAEMAPPGLPDRAARDRGRAALARGSAAPHLEQGPPGATSSGRGGVSLTPPLASHSARASTSGSPAWWVGPRWSASSGETGSRRSTARSRAS